VVNIKVVLLNGGKQSDEVITRIQSIVINEFNHYGCEIECIDLENINISSCLGCFGCWVKTPGICVINDAGRTVAEKVIQSDLVIFFTPIVFGGYSSDLKKAADRLIPLISPYFTKINNETHHKPRYEKHPALLGIGVSYKAEAEKEKIFKTLVERNAINFHSPSCAANILIKNENEEVIKGKIRELIEEVGVLNG
jgi:multimeric flavodoxin WrbA